MSLSVAVNFRKVGHGWADLQFSFGNQVFSASGVSHTTDAVGDLLRSALLIVTGADRAAVSFDREPAEWRIQLISALDIATGVGPMQFRVFEFEDINDRRPDGGGREVFHADCDALEFGEAVLKMGRDLADHFENLGWDVPYPVAAVHALESALRTYRSGYGTL